MQVADKTVVIAGLGVSGTSLAEVLRERGAHVIGVDERKAMLICIPSTRWIGIRSIM